MKRQKQITKRALKEAGAGGHDVVILDTAGRLELDDTLMSELKNVVDIAQPAEKISCGRCFEWSSRC